MSIRTFAMPDVGEGLTEAEIVHWHVAAGDDVAVNQVLVEIETAKAVVELPSPFAGRVVELLFAPAVTVPVGTPIISIDTAPAGVAAPAPGDPRATGNGAAGYGMSPHEPEGNGPAGHGDAVDGVAGHGAARYGAEAPTGGAKIGELTADGRIATLVGYLAPEGPGRRRRRGPAPTRPADLLIEASTSPLAAPPVRKLAKDLGVDLSRVPSGRPDGLITREAVQAFAGGSAHGRAAGPIRPANPWTDPDRERRVPIRGLRKATAQAMVASAFTAPHVSEFLTVDMTPTMDLRERLRLRPEFRDVKLTPLAFAARAVCIAAARTPEVNSTWDGDAGEIVYKSYVHLGIAADTPRGLIVPVIKDADRMSLLQLAAALAELTAAARAGRTTPEEMAGSSITITNIGVLGVDSGTPIINPGESAILAVGSIKDAPWVVDGQLAVRKVGQLALSFDHRIIDGAQGSRFLADVGSLLADPALALVW